MPAVLSLRLIRRKVRSVTNIKKITRAMQMVSAAKLRKVQDRLLAVRPYADKMAELLSHLASKTESVRHPFFEKRPQVKASGVIVIAADKGLCGSYNANLIRLTERLIAEKGRPVKLFAVGRKAADYFSRRGRDLSGRHLFLPIHVSFSAIQEIVQPALAMFLKGEIDEIDVVYTKYVNALTFKAMTTRFVPVEPPKGAGGDEQVIFEPAPEKIIEALVPRYVETQFQHLLMESFSSEHAGRMNAMKNATDNAQELITDLTLTGNRARQASITKELLDIVGGAEALKSA